MTDRRSSLLSRIVTGVSRLRGSAGANQSAMVAGMVVAALAITGGLVLEGPRVGSAVADNVICHLAAETDCGHGNTGPQQQDQVPVAAPLSSRFDLDGVSDPLPVTHGGSGTSGDHQVDFDHCWIRSHSSTWATTTINRICTTGDGAVYECQYFQQFKFFIHRNLCEPASGTSLPALVSCPDGPAGGGHCAAITLDADTSWGGRDYLVYENPALADNGQYGTLQEACARDVGHCNAELARQLTAVASRAADVWAPYAQCDGSLTNTQTELHTILDPATGQPAVMMRSDHGWVDPTDPNLDPNTRAAIAYLLRNSTRALAADTHRGRPLEQLPPLLLTSQAVDDALDGLSVPPGLTCADISAALGRINDGRPGIGDSIGYVTTCALPADDGSCEQWATVPESRAEDADPGATVGPLEVSQQAEDELPVPGLVPGRPDASYDEAVAYCQDHSADCAAAARRDVADSLATALRVMQDIGLCDGPQQCQDLATYVNDHSDGCAAGGPAGWTARAAPVAKIIRVTAVAGVIGCGIVFGGLGGQLVGWGAGVAITAAVITTVGVLNELAAYQFEQAPQAAAAALMFDQFGAQLAAMERGQADLRADNDALRQQLQAQGEFNEYLVDRIDALQHPHQN